MRRKKFYIRCVPLMVVIFWALVAATITFFLWPDQSKMDAGPIPVTIEMETPRLVKTESPVTTVVPSVLPSATVEPKIIIPRYGFTEDDIYLMAVLLTGSEEVSGDGEFDFDYGRSEEYDQISLVLCVVMNRVRSESFPNTVSEVIWQKNQFSLMPIWEEGLPQVSDISLQKVTEWCEAYDAYDPGAQSIPEDHLYFSGDGHNNYSR